MKYWIFNLKAKLTYEQIKEYEQKITDLKKKIIIAPSAIYLTYFQERGFTTCAQNISKYSMGNYTGEVNAMQLKSIGCSYALIGHYERRLYFNESDQDFVAKIKQALKAQIKVIYCIGESFNNKNKAQTFDVLQKQINNVLKNFPSSELKKIIIAYEPFWLVGSKQTLDINYLNEVLTWIKNYINKEYHIIPKLIYGGSINLYNLKALKELSIDGLLIGSLSTEIDDVFTLLKELKQ